VAWLTLVPQVKQPKAKRKGKGKGKRKGGVGSAGGGSSSTSAAAERSSQASSSGQGTTMEEGWGNLPEELLTKVLEDGLGWAREVSRAVRLVSRRWQVIHDGNCTTARASVDDNGWAALTDAALMQVSDKLPRLRCLDLTKCREVTDEGLAAALNSHPTLTSLTLSLCYGVTDECMRRVSSSLPMLTSLDLSECRGLSDAGVLQVRELPALTAVNLSGCSVTDKGVRAVCELPALTSLDLAWCSNVTDIGMRAALQSLERRGGPEPTDKRMPALSALILTDCFNVTALGVQALRRAHPSLRIDR
jgi:hypothetical protein